MRDLKELAKLGIGLLREAGAEVAQCEVTETEKREFNVDGGEFSLFRTLFNNRVTLTAFRGQRKGSVTVNRFDTDSLRAAAADCLSVADSGVADPAWEIAGKIGEREFRSGAPEPDTDLLFTRTRELMGTVCERYPRILMEQMTVSHSRVESVYADTSENLYHELSGIYNVSLMFSAHDGERSSSFLGTGFGTDRLDVPFIDCGSVDRSLSDAERQIETAPVSGKFEGTVIFTPDCLAEMLDSIVGNFASGTGLIDGTSIWKSKLGQRVAAPSVTVSVAPQTPGIVYREEYTGDGYPTENFDLIRDGVLKSFVASSYVANKAGCPRSAGTSSAYVMPAGDRTLDELISGVERGLLVARFSGGNPSCNGDFSGVAKNSFLIENGQLGCAVSETMISGNLAEMLNHPAGITSERVADGATLLPYAAFSGITVSGK